MWKKWLLFTATPIPNDFFNHVVLICIKYRQMLCNRVFWYRPVIRKGQKIVIIEVQDFHISSVQVSRKMLSE